jgi:pimeloyl-ACP methyl ester carboxylesterase
LNERYTWIGSGTGQGFGSGQGITFSEQMLRVAADAAIQIILIPPLFEEANRLRKTLVDVLRGLEARGFGVTLPDLPAMGESLIAYSESTVQDWGAALAALAEERRRKGQKVIMAAFRGGALIDSAAPSDGIWRLSQETGERLLRDISRMIMARANYAKGDNPYDEAGYALPLGLIDALEQAVPQPAMKLRSVRLTNDSAEADARIAGSPLWRRSEPEEDIELTAAIVADLAEWATLCAKS